MLGIGLVHSQPGRPQGRGKIERFFRTLRSQFLVEIAGRENLTLAELNRLLQAWVEQAYHRTEHSETHQAPIERFTSADPPRHATAPELREAFLWAEMRTVSKTATVSLYGNAYEVDDALVGRTVQLLFDPFCLDRIEVRHQQRSFGEAIAHEITRHVHPRAQPEPDAQAPPASTAIDYLRLLAADHEHALRDRIAYRDITTNPTSKEHS